MLWSCIEDVHESDREEVGLCSGSFRQTLLSVGWVGQEEYYPTSRSCGQAAAESEILQEVVWEGFECEIFNTSKADRHDKVTPLLLTLLTAVDLQQEAELFYDGSQKVDSVHLERFSH